MSGRTPLLVLCLFALLLVACGGERTVLLTEWTLEAPGSANTRVTLPRHLDLPAHPSRYALHTELAVPPDFRGKPLTLAIPHFWARCALSANGHETTSLDADEADGYRGDGFVSFRVPADESAEGRLALDLHVEHVWTQSAWLDTVPRLSATPRGDRWARFVRTFNNVTAIAAAVTVLVVFLSYLILYLLDRRDAAHRWFAIEAAAGCIYPAFQLGLTAPVFGVYDAPIMATSLSVALWASVHFTHAQFQIGRPYRRLDVLLALSIVAAVVTANPFVSTHFVAPITVLFIGFNVSYQLKSTFTVWQQHRRRFHAFVLFVSWGALGTFASLDAVAWLGAGELGGGLRGGSLGLIVIAVLQSAVLSRDHHVSRRRTERLNRELAGRVEMLQSKNQEVQVLNDELRRQIAARSEQLSDALARLTAPSAGATRALNEGDVVDGRYRVVRDIGSGGMGTVYEVERIADRRRLALKVLSSAGNGAEMARFAREAQIVAQLSHPNIVSIVDVDVAASGFFYLVMELVDGLSLRQHTSRYGDVRWARAVLRQIAEGLAAVHARGIVHRDLKPANVLLTLEPEGNATLPRVKIADFGVSTVPVPVEGAPADARTLGAVPAARPSGPKALQARDGATAIGSVPPSVPSAPMSQASLSGPLTETGVLIGTPRYMAPELATGARLAKASSDIFSFGVIAYELLTGNGPFAEPLALRKLSGQGSSSPPPALCALCPSLETSVASLLELCLAENPDARPTASELARALGAPPSPVA